MVSFVCYKLQTSHRNSAETATEACNLNPRRTTRPIPKLDLNELVYRFVHYLYNQINNSQQHTCDCTHTPMIRTHARPFSRSPRTPLLSYHRNRWQCTYHRSKYHNLVLMRFPLTGKCLHRMAYATRSVDYPCRSRRTICRRRQIAKKVHSFRVDVAGICPASWRVVPRRANFPFRPLTSRLKVCNLRASKRILMSYILFWWKTSSLF